MLKTAVELLKRRGIELDLLGIPLDDAKSYAMLSRGETVGIFQVEGQGMRRALMEMQPDRFEDIIALVALYRPGPMANIPTYCARKHGKEQPEYIHPKLEPVLRETFGVIVYQEQVMEAARRLVRLFARRSRPAAPRDGQEDPQRNGGAAQALRRRRGERRCREGAGRGDLRVAARRFADYGFNKSHAAAYALVAYQTAYMKANYPVEFLAASMTYDMANTDKLSEFRAEAVRLGVKVEPPSVNRSGADFDVEGSTIHYSLAALKGVGREAVKAIVDARGDKPFRDVTDFAGRINPRAINKRVLESLSAAGAFDALDGNRARVHAGVDVILAAAQRRHEDAVVGQNELFGGAATREELRMPAAQPWLPAERLQREFDAIGFFLSGHPLDDYAAILERLKVQRWTMFCNSVKQGATAGRVAGTVVSRAERRTKTGNKMGILEFSDPSGHYEAVIFQEGLMQYRDLLEPGKAVLLMLTAEAQGEDVRARIQTVEPLDAAAEKMQKGLRVFVNSDQPIESVARRLEPARAGPRAIRQRQRRRRDHDGADARQGYRRRGEASRPLQGLAADRRRHQGGAGRGAGRGGVEHDPEKCWSGFRTRSCSRDNP